MSERTLRFNPGSGLAEVRHQDGYIALGRYATEVEAVEALRSMLNYSGPILMCKAGQQIHEVALKPDTNNTPEEILS